mmetsp:Transcript_8820/g.29020  ORF Transcript_8820/g.29020 Transcript_8820/m.29020 type:complete len:266 (+) Transcript_8820:73-870(+)
MRCGCLGVARGPEADEGNLEPVVHFGRGGEHARADVLDDGCVPRRGQVLAPVGERPLAGGLRLEDKSEEGVHGKAAVLDLLGLELKHVALREPERVEDAARVARRLVGHRVALEDGVLVHRARLADVLPAADLNPVHEQELNREQPPKVEVALRKLRKVLRERRLVPENLRVHNLLRHNARNPPHSPPRVHELRLPVVRQRLRVAAEAERVQPVVSGHGAVQIIRGQSSREPHLLLGGHRHESLTSASLGRRAAAAERRSAAEHV